MDMKLLRAFVTLARLGSYHDAAEAMYITQPALTKKIQSLEKITGIALFQRGRQGAKLTEPGKQLLSRAQKLLKHYEEFSEYAQNLQKGSSGKLTLGFGISSFQLAPRCVSLFREQYPDVEVLLDDVPSDVQCRMLLDGKLLAGFTREPLTDKLNFSPLFTESLVLAIPAGFTLKSQKIQSILNQYQLLQMTPDRGRGLVEQTEKFLKENNYKGKPSSAANDIHTLLALVATGNGVALLPAGTNYLLPKGVSLIRPEGNYTKWNIGIAWNPQINDIIRDNFLQIVNNIRLNQYCVN
ncbi:LysR family transcriptional regulator [Escherichia sp. E2593]|nr:LysR family transcriptional regulator [Escherichia sp. E1V33]RZN36927.1 LysR family transcriptional regulator [Escherichia sp. E10V5]TBR64414.1 LysR family transcriptional regulator [Escherichia sp. E10V4]TBR65027.1 LysR family transcriptional regulator [Escherichia sp. E1S7]TGB52746.1 LysR family transcriptional regulator [Escherichia sp. E5028]TGC03759.1 LysR family transcriptional regulator [Escherichia sp. E2586]TGC05310.1 LysR family transcriptional regulator [Escherichia sp. E2593]